MEPYNQDHFIQIEKCRHIQPQPTVFFLLYKMEAKEDELVAVP